jgi:pimeloyl-ACP methyl ester carboxylesterase
VICQAAPVTRRHAGSFALLVVALAANAVAQVDRYELGLRLRAFERRLAAATSETRRTAAFAELQRAVQAFFRLDTTTVARAIDAADAALAEPRSNDQVHAASLQLVLAHRLHDHVAEPELAFEVQGAYPVDGATPADLRLTVRLDGDSRDRAALDVPLLPATGTIDLRGAAAGDRLVAWTVHAGGKVVLTRTQGLSLAEGLAARIAALPDATKNAGAGPPSLRHGTLALWSSMLTGMTRQRREETVLPGARLLDDAARLAAHIAAPAADQPPFFGPQRTGQDWLRVPVAGTTVVLRLLVPPGLAAPTPLVLALHGAGGSENLFFDVYGDGAIVTECARRGWLLAAPRGGLTSTDLPALVDALAQHWPIDPKHIFLVGHSMGAAQAIAAATRTPERFAAVAALGGGGAFRRTPDTAPPQFFVGVGSEDFALAGARNLHRTLEQAAVPVTFREYPTVEHLAIVQVALPEVFAFFAAARADAESTSAGRERRDGQRPR